MGDGEVARGDADANPAEAPSLASPPPELLLRVLAALTRDWPSRAQCAGVSRAWRDALRGNSFFRPALGWLADEFGVCVPSADEVGADEEGGAWRRAFLCTLSLVAAPGRPRTHAASTFCGAVGATVPGPLSLRVFCRFRPLLELGGAAADRGDKDSAERRPLPPPLHLRMASLRSALGCSTAEAAERLFGVAAARGDPWARAQVGGAGGDCGDGAAATEADDEGGQRPTTGEPAPPPSAFAAAVLSVSPRQVLCLQPSGAGLRAFAFDRAFDGGAPTASVHAACCAPAVRSWLNGASCLVFAYGPTGSGKTASLHGLGDAAWRVPPAPSAAAGFAPRAVAAALAELRRRASLNVVGGEPRQTLFLSYVEIFGQVVTDLLPPPLAAPAAPTVVGAWGGVAAAALAAGAAEVPCPDEASAAALLRAGGAARRVAATAANARSSRAHALLRLTLRPSGRSLTIADLGGSERASARAPGGAFPPDVARTAADRLRAAEAVQINLALSALQSVLRALRRPPPAPGAQPGHVPFGDSRLTEALGPALRAAAASGGVAALLVTARLEARHGREAVRALRFAAAAAGVAALGGGGEGGGGAGRDAGAADALARIAAELGALDASVAAAEVWRDGRPAGAEALRERQAALLAARAALLL